MERFIPVILGKTFFADNKTVTIKMTKNNAFRIQMFNTYYIILLLFTVRCESILNWHSENVKVILSFHIRKAISSKLICPSASQIMYSINDETSSLGCYPGKIR